MIPITIDPALAAQVPDLRLGVVIAYDVVIQAHDAVLWTELEAVAAELRIEFAGRAAADRAEIALTRQAYRRLGDDPTHYRPSNEALLRRVLSGKPLPQINTAVDANTLVSLTSGWSLGCYNLAAIDGPITVRQALPGEHYAPIGKPPVAAGQRLVLADDQGIFGSPTADSTRTQVVPGVQQLLWVIFAFDGQPPAQAVSHGQHLIERYCNSSERPVTISLP